MDALTLPAPPHAFRISAIAPPHAGTSGVAVVEVHALDEHGSPVTAYLHLPAELLARLAVEAAAWIAEQPTLTGTHIAGVGVDRPLPTRAAA